MKKIYLKAYKNLNFGDDLFVQMISQRYSEVKFQFVAEKEVFFPFLNLKNIVRISLPKIIYKIDNFFKKIGLNINFVRNIERIYMKKSYATVHIGGSIFIESHNYRNQLSQYQKDINFSKNYFVLGANFGPYSHKEFYFEFLNMFKQVNDICFRDSYSYNLFDLANVRKAPDIVFGLDTETLDISSNNEIIISILDFSTREDLKKYSDLYENYILSVVEQISKRGYIPVLTSFCKSEGDELFITKIITKLDNSINYKTHFYAGDISETLNIVASSKAVIGTRFHCIILALVFEKPVIPIIYSKKTENMLIDIDFKNFIQYPDKFEEFNHENIFTYFDNYISPKGLKKAKELSKEHFKKLDIFLK